MKQKNKNIVRLTKDEEYRRWDAHMKRLLAKKSIHKYIIFDDTNEGNLSPHGIESSSGALLTSDGRVFHYWFDWDEQKNDYTLISFYLNTSIKYLI